MIVAHYEDFTSLHKGICKEALTNPELEAFVVGSNAYIGPLVLVADSWEMATDLADLAFYTEHKLKSLVYTYIDPDQYFSIKEKLETSKATVITFYFKQKKKVRGVAGINGPCLISIEFTKMKRRDPWEIAHIYYRTTELVTRFAADLVLFNLLIKEVCPGIKKIYIHIPIAYLSLGAAVAYQKLLDIPDKGISNMGDIAVAFYRIKKRMMAEDITTYKVLARHQMKFKGMGRGRSADLTDKTIRDFIKEEK